MTGEQLQNQAGKDKTENEDQKKRGFTTAEKWIIWAVFCLLVALSTYRISLFAGLMLVPAGVSMITHKKKLLLGIALCVAGVLNLVFSPRLP